MTSPLPVGPRRTASRIRLLVSTTLAVGGVVGAAVFVPGQIGSLRSGEDAFKAAADRSTKSALDEQAVESGEALHGDPLIAAEKAGLHVHNDPASKNSLSRTLGDKAPTDDTRDPTSMLQRIIGNSVVAEQRKEPDPEIVPGSAPAARTTVPGNRYAMAGGCYGLRLPNGSWVTAAEDGTIASGPTATPFFFKATRLGSYLLFSPAKTFLAVAPSSLELAADPSDLADFEVKKSTTGFTFTSASGAPITVDGSTVAVGETPTPLGLRLKDGCAAFPEVKTNISGQPFRGVSNVQEVRGYTDAHTHGMAFEFLGGDVHCGKPWDPYGVTYALVDCPDHSVADGHGALLEDFLAGNTPGSGHDPIGWPTFNYWPAPHSLTHEGTYYKWMERAWRGGLRVFVNLLVENNKLCQLYPLKHNSCDDMDAVRLQAADMYAFQDYIDAQSGGPGKGWYRIVKDPFEARKVINQGKLAVVMGIETSVVFGCTMKADVPECTEEDITTQLDEVHDLGVRQMELVNKFDNALSGVAGDGGTIGPLVNGANFLETGSFWSMQTCPESNADGVADNEQMTSAPEELGGRDSIFAAIMGMYGAPVAPPIYATGPHCNTRGLTDLGDFMIREMADRGMLFDPDHMSVKARKASLDVMESIQYPGVVSSHSWSTPDAYPRIYKLGGFVAPYAGDSTGFVNKWKQHLGWADPRFYFGFGYGADINGFGAQGDARGADVTNPVTYPFTGLGGITVNKQVSGKQVYDINADGVAHYGMYPDWIQDLKKVGGNAIGVDMARGAEAYLQTWERALGVTNDACRDPQALKSARTIRGIDAGARIRSVLMTAGQPHSRLDDTFTYCAWSTSGVVKVAVEFNARGRVIRTR
jgi:hypothetical protein